MTYVTASRHKSLLFVFRTSGFRLQASGFRLQASDFGLQASDFRLQTSGFRLRTSGFRLQTSDFRLRTSGFRLQEENAPCRLPSFSGALSLKSEASGLAWHSRFARFAIFLLSPARTASYNVPAETGSSSGAPELRDLLNSCLFDLLDLVPSCQRIDARRAGHDADKCGQMQKDARRCAWQPPDKRRSRRTPQAGRDPRRGHRPLPGQPARPWEARAWYGVERYPRR